MLTIGVVCAGAGMFSSGLRGLAKAERGPTAHYDEGHDKGEDNTELIRFSSR